MAIIAAERTRKYFYQIIADLLRKDYNSIKHWLYTM